MTQRPFLIDAAVTTWHGRAGLLWPIFSACALSVLRLGMIFWCAGAAYHLSGSSAPYWGALLGLAAGAGVIFHAACEVKWWRSFIAASGAKPRRSSAHDLLAILTLDIIFGCSRHACAIASACCAFAGMPFPAALGALLALASAVLHPAMTAQKLMTGKALPLCARDAAHLCMSRPFAVLAAHFLPCALSATFGLAALLCALAQYPAMCSILALLAAVTPLAQPALWASLARGRRAVCEA
ncbi:MAG: hypothetical protein IJ165_05125 [Proteobacteria bacterium]|nr:hypothetical protein [Pseudomonadota bacterium]